MFGKIFILLLGLSFSLASEAKVDPAACSSITNQINADIEKYPSNLQNQPLAWKDLKWLEEKLGPFTIITGRAEEFATHQDLRKYTWRCGGGTGAYLSVFVDNENKIAKVIGQYSSREGSGIFATDFNTSNIKTFPAEENDKSCANIIKAIEKDAKIESYPYMGSDEVLQEKHPPEWFNLSWLQNQLGPAETTVSKQNLYVWKNYKLLVFDGKSKQASGTFPKKESFIPSLDEVVKVLGSPDKNYSEQIIRYTWRCPELPQIMISAIASNNTVLDLSFSACPIKNCDAFKYNWGESQLETQVRITEVDKPSSEADVFGSDPTKFQADNVAKVKSFYANLRECKPGTFAFNQNYPFMGPVLMTNVIQGKQNNVCNLEMTYVLPVEPGMPKMRGQNKCQIPLDKLSVFTEEAANIIGQGDLPASPIDNLFKNNCQVYINGQQIHPD